MRRFLLTILVVSMALSISVDARKIEKVSTTLQNQQKLRVSTKAMAQRKHFEMLAAEHGVTIEWIDNLVEGATNAWTGMTNSFSRLATRFSTGVREFKDQTKYLLNMLQLKKPGGYTAAFCKHARDDTCAVVDNYPWQILGLVHCDLGSGDFIFFSIALVSVWCLCVFLLFNNEKRR